MRQDSRVPLPTRAAAALVLTAVTIVVVLLTGLSVLDPFHWRHVRWFSLALVFLAILLVTATLAVATRGVLRAIVLVLGTVAVLGWAALGWFAISFDQSYREIETVADGDRRLVVLEGGALAIDPRYSVVVRSGGGLFEQQSFVYQGLEDGPGVAVRFVDADTVEVTAGSCVYRSEIEGGTLEVDPVHSPLLAGAC